MRTVVARRVGFAVISVLTIACAACGAAGAPPTAPPVHPSRPPVALAQPRGTNTAVQPTPQLTAVERPFSPIKPRSTVQRSAANRPKAGASPDHIVVVIFENKYRSSVIGSGHAPYLNKLAGAGASMTRSYGVTHPSQPNYLALFSGSTQGVTSDACPQDLGDADNLGHQLRKSGRSFVGYASLCLRPAFAGAGRVATSASTTHGSTSARCRQAVTGLSPTFRATTASCRLWRS